MLVEILKVNIEPISHPQDLLTLISLLFIGETTKVALESTIDHLKFVIYLNMIKTYSPKTSTL